MDSLDLLSKIRLLRKVLDYSQENISLELGITQYAYSKIENGRTRLGYDHLLGIARCLGCSLGELVEFPLDELLRRIRERRNAHPAVLRHS